jgi:hypothetical protein
MHLPHQVTRKGRPFYTRIDGVPMQEVGIDGHEEGKRDVWWQFAKRDPVRALNRLGPLGENSAAELPIETVGEARYDREHEQRKGCQGN